MPNIVYIGVPPGAHHFLGQAVQDITESWGDGKPFLVQGEPGRFVQAGSNVLVFRRTDLFYTQEDALRNGAEIAFQRSVPTEDGLQVGQSLTAQASYQPPAKVLDIPEGGANVELKSDGSARVIHSDGLRTEDLNTTIKLGRVIHPDGSIGLSTENLTATIKLDRETGTWHHVTDPNSDLISVTVSYKRFLIPNSSGNGSSNSGHCLLCGQHGYLEIDEYAANAIHHMEDCPVQVLLTSRRRRWSSNPHFPLTAVTLLGRAHPASGKHCQVRIEEGASAGSMVEMSREDVCPTLEEATEKLRKKIELEMVTATSTLNEYAGLAERIGYKPTVLVRRTVVHQDSEAVKSLLNEVSTAHVKEPGQEAS